MPDYSIPQYPFSPTAKPEAPALFPDEQSVKDFLKRLYNSGSHFGLDNVAQNGVHRVAGWAFDLRAYLKPFFIEEYNTIYKRFAPNKTALRRALHLSRNAKLYQVVPA